MARLIDGVPISEPVLDVGCASGVLLELLRGREVVGVDIDPLAVERAYQHGLPARWGDLESGLDLPVGHYRTVFAIDVIEHLRSPIAGAEELARLLHPQGLLVLTTANAGSPMRFLPRVDAPFREPDHIVYFTGWTLRKLLEKAGLRVVRMETRSYGLPLVGRLGWGGQLFVLARL
jgi:2-polyprenyl-3-methyl-5-hydroxy-6-metoxy-1,4-benzoquinol methylase